MTMPSEDLDELLLSPQVISLRRLLAVGARALSLTGHDDFNQGQISARIPNRDLILIKGALVGFDECTPADIIIAPLDDKHPAPKLAPPELPLHQATYQARPDVRSVVHSHARHTLVFGVTDLPLMPVSHDGAYFAGRVERFTATSDTVLDINVARAVAAQLGENPGVLLQNHGGVIVGKSVKHAVIFAQLLERACELQLLAACTGASISYSSQRDVASKLDFIYADLSVRSYWEHMARKVARMFPELSKDF